jgi:hypothetical protein
MEIIVLQNDCHILAISNVEKLFGSTIFHGHMLKFLDSHESWFQTKKKLESPMPLLQKWRIHLFSYMESHAHVQRHKEGKSLC